MSINYQPKRLWHKGEKNGTSRADGVDGGVAKE